jgi:hypothetical protein
VQIRQQQNSCTMPQHLCTCIEIHDIALGSLILPRDPCTSIQTYIFIGIHAIFLGFMTLHWYPCICIGICVHSLGYVSPHWDPWQCIGQCDRDSTSSCMPPRSLLEGTLFLEEYSHTCGFVELVILFCPHVSASYGGWSWLRGCYTHLDHFLRLLSWLWVGLTTHA